MRICKVAQRELKFFVKWFPLQIQNLVANYIEPLPKLRQV